MVGCHPINRDVDLAVAFENFRPDHCVRAFHLMAHCFANVMEQSCPFCASDDLDAIAIDQDRAMLAVSCKECGATGPLSLSDDPAHAIHSWDQRMGRLNSVKRQWQRL